MTTETKFRAGIAMSLLGLIIMTFEFFEKDREYNEIKSSLSHSVNKQSYDSLLIENRNLSDFNDSIRTELFIERNTVGRYEMGLDFLKERRPNEYNLVMHFINTQTE
jgi:hypothetical protein